MWKAATVCIPQACPFARSACDQTTGLVVGGEDQEAAAARLDAITPRLIDVEEEGLLNRVLVRAGLDQDAVLEKNVGGAQHVLALVDEVRDVVESAAGTRQVARIRDVV